jgi:DNA invertase Pin-like site-specific DNA recombinase
MSKCYGYGRASTGKQAVTESVQRRAVEEYYRRELQPKGIAWGGWFYDPATSGDQPFSERPEGLRVWVTAQPGDFIVASKSDRVFRNTKDGLVTMEALLAKQVRCVMIDMPYDTRDANAELLFTIQLAVNRWERRKIGERTSAAMKEIGRSGLHRIGGGRQSTPIGWMRNGTGFVEDHEERGRVEQMARWRDEEGLSFNQLEMRVSYPPFNWRRRISRKKGGAWSPRYIRLALEARSKGYPRAYLNSRSRRAAAARTPDAVSP